VASRDKLLIRLELLTNSQFKAMLFRLDNDIPASHLPSGDAPQTVRAIDLIRLLEQQSKLGLLQRLLDELDWFKEFLPEGAYPVGQKLREREEARERQDMEEAKARDEDPEDYLVTPEKFYTFKPEADWLGIFRGWDAPWTFHSELLQRVVDASRNRKNCPAAAIIGHGGSGKSVALRRLAVDLAEQGYKVWWVKEPEQLLQFGLSKFEVADDGPHFLLVDDIHNLEDGYAKRYRRYLQKNRSLVLVVAGRGLPTAFKVRVGPGSGLFDPYDAGDRSLVLNKIADVIPKWADTAKELATEPLQKARLIRLLVVLARRKVAPRNLEELESFFLEILADDIGKIRSVLPGLADAVIDATAIREVGRDISHVTLIALADYRQPEKHIPILLEDVIGNQRWKVLESLMSHNPEYDTVQFHHDELAEGIISAGRKKYLGSRIIIDDAWRREILDVVINRGSVFSSSYALSGFVRQYPDIISQERALEYIRQLLAAGNGHHAYLRLIVDEALDLKQQERLELLLVAARIVPFNNWLWGAVWGWIQRHYQKKEERCEVLEQLHQAGCQEESILIPLLQHLTHKKACVVAKRLIGEIEDPHVLCTCIKLLGNEAKDDAKRLLKKSENSDVLCTCIKLLGDEAKDDAKRLLKKSENPEILCTCIKLLGDEAKDDAKRLLKKSENPDVLCTCIKLLVDEAKDDAKRLLKKSENPEILCTCIKLLGNDAKDDAERLLTESNDSQVHCTCLDLLDDAAKPFALERIPCWTETDPALLVRCFQVAGATPEAGKAAAEMLVAWNNRVPPILRAVALRAPFDTPLRIQRAYEVLHNWREEYRQLVGAALTAFWNEPDAVTEYCISILRRWHQEIFYRHRHHLIAYDGHIIKALSHPALKDDAYDIARKMLATEAREPGFLSPELRRQAENIIRGEGPIWSGSDEEISV